jgi:DNA-binding transcriptional LysR family regulator
MNEEWLRSFVAFAERMSFTAAARALHISQPALHVQVRKLSESLGVVLYHREGRVLVLTSEGERVLAFVSPLPAASAWRLRIVSERGTHEPLDPVAIRPVRAA